MSRRAAVRFAAVAGLGLLLFAPLTHATRPTREDYDLSETPFFRIPLATLRQSGRATFTFQVPVGEQWTRIRAAWSDPGIMVFAVSDQRMLFEFPTLKLDVDVRSPRGAVAVTPADAVPYMTRGFTSSEHVYREGLTGVRCSPAPGEDLTVTFTASHPEALPDGELYVKYEWALQQKDHILGTSIDGDGQHVAVWAVRIGIGLLAFAAIVGAVTF
jgi:hypothetical protein